MNEIYYMYFAQYKYLIIIIIIIPSHIRSEKNDVRA